MARIKIPHGLPPLAKLLPGFTALPTRRGQRRELAAVLREIARQLRGTVARQFYTARELGDFFDLHPSVVLQAFGELEKEGLLVRRRSAGTLLQPARPQPRHPVRGVVGVPIWRMGFCHLREWQVFLMAVERELARHHLVADFVFFEHAVVNPAPLLEQLLRHHLDSVLWFQPHWHYRTIIETLHDQGLPSAVVTVLPAPWPCASYRLAMEQAIRRTARLWRRDGLREVIVVSRYVQPFDQELRPLFAELGLACTRTTELLTPAPPPHVGVFLADDAIANSLALHSPDPLVDLLRHNCVLLRNQLNCDPGRFAGGRADVISFDWEKLASHIASDIATGQLLQRREPVVSAAKLQLRADAAQFAQAF